MNEQQLAAVKQALEALEELTSLHHFGFSVMYDTNKAITALQSIISQDALDKMADNARELGLDYEPAPVQEPVAVVSGYHGGQCVVTPTNPARLFSTGTAFYTTAAQPAVQDGRDWSLLEATQESLREHMAEINRLQKEIIEQCRIIAMSAEREDSLRAEIKRLKAAQPAPVQEPSFKEWTQDYVRDNIHKLKSTPPAAQPAVQEPVAFVAPNGDLRKTTEAKDASEWGAKFTPLYTAKPAVQPAVQTWPVSQDPATQLQVAQIIAMRDSTPPEAQPGVKEG